MIKNMGMVVLSGKMAAHMKENGKMVNNMVKVQ